MSVESLGYKLEDSEDASFALGGAAFAVQEKLEEALAD